MSIISAPEAHIAALKLAQSAHTLAKDDEATTALLTMPDDIAMKIIRHTVIDDLKVDHKRLLRTMLVCQRFYAIAVATADIWTEINLDWPIVWVLQYMERSKGCPLRLRTRLMSCIEDSCIESAINRAESLDAWLYAGSHRRLLLALKKGDS
jgi:hypothetical protein